ncbi:MAG: energy transducer TonB [Pseudomonadota bacterium]
MKRLFLVSPLALFSVGIAHSEACTQTVFSADKVDAYLSAQRSYITGGDKNAILADLGRLLASNPNCFEQARIMELFNAVDGMGAPPAPTPEPVVESAPTPPLAEQGLTLPVTAPTPGGVPAPVPTPAITVDLPAPGSDAASDAETTPEDTVTPTPVADTVSVVSGLQVLYPLSMMAARLEGDCAVTFDVAADGSVQEPITADCTDERFRISAEQAVSRAIFEPAGTAGATYTVKFRIPR